MDELILRVLCNMLILRLDYEVVHSQAQRREDRATVLHQLVTDLLKARSQFELVQTMRKRLAAYHGFEDCGILFYNNHTNQLFTVLHEAGAFSYPPAVGICGEIVDHPEVRVKDPRSEHAFSSEIDNLVDCKQIRNYLYGPLFDCNGKLIAIIQLLNKLRNSDVADQDIQRFQHLSTCYGLIVEKMNEKEQILHTVVGLQDSIKAISKFMPNVEPDTFAEEEMGLGQLAKSMKFVSEIMDDMASGKRTDMIKDLAHAAQVSGS